MSKAKEAPTRRRVQFFCTGPSLTRQEFKDECDVNQVLARFVKTGVLDHVAKHGPRYGDFIGLPNLHESQNMIRAANQMFMELPAAVRKRFSNDAQEFIDFMAEEANADEARELGLLPALKTTQAAEPPEAPEGAPGGPQGAPDAGGAGGRG